jgi:D-alanyl-D-alanine dipeptidase
VTSPHTDRIDRARVEAATQHFGAVVVPPSPDLAYLTGYEPMPLERPTLLVLRPDDDPVLLVPALEEPLARASIAADVAFVTWFDGDDPYDAATRLLPRGGRVAVGDRLWATHLLGLQRSAPAVSFVPASAVLGRLRAVKDADELAALRLAARGADETFRRICAMPFVGRREEEIAGDLAALLVEHGHARADFTIVASGSNAASPHHEPGRRMMVPRDAVVLDFGGELGGYFSDTSRTVVVEDEPEGFREIYELVREAQQAAVDLVAPGVEIQEIDRAARAVIDAGGYGHRFVHRTGHGIGREVHEPPYAVEGDDTRLEPGMTFSVEPGIYLEGRFGVRIEDIVAVTDGGVDRLNRSSRELQVVG